MFWADKIVLDIKEEYKEKIKSGKPLIIRDEKTASGRVHVGSLRGVAIHGIISEILSEEKINNKYLYEINDFDPMDGIPSYLPKEKYEEYMGKPLCSIPSPDGKAKNYAEYFAEEFISVIDKIGFKPEYYRSSDLYKSGKFNEAIKDAILNAEKIREIYKKVSGSQKTEEWLPIQIICENCGKISTTRGISFDGKEVEYICEENLVTWTKGCGFKGKRSPFDGNAKLPWKVEWAAKFKVLDVDVEGAGKDHSTKGGSRDISEAICQEVFNHKPPFNIPYEFFQVGGKKMSSSKGAGLSSFEIGELLPPELIRFLLLGKDPKRVIDFIPDGDTIPVLYDNYDKFAEEYFSNAEGDYKRIFFLMHTPENRNKINQRFLPRFSQIAFLVQMPHIDTIEAVEKMKGDKLTDDDKIEISYRSKFALGWIKKYAPEDFKFELQDKVPESATSFSDIQKSALKSLSEYIKSQEILSGQDLHTKLHEIRKETDINPQDFFKAIYQSILGKESGPKAGWFLSVLDKKFLEKRLEEVSI
jgi:lysyl-tRNA synthetase class 1